MANGCFVIQSALDEFPNGCNTRSQLEGHDLPLLPKHISHLAGLNKYSAIVVADPRGSKQKRGTVRVTYLGVNGYQL